MFAYCGNNPILSSDPNGYYPIWERRYEGGITAYTDKAPSVSKGDYNDFLDALGFCESSNDYSVENTHGYLGRYQLGNLALQDAGFLDSDLNWTETANSYGVFCKNDFLASPEAQDAAVKACHIKICEYIRVLELDKYIGSRYCNVIVTKSGLLAACHLVGANEMKRALESGEDSFDAYGASASDNMKAFAGYDIKIVWGE